MIKVPKGEIQKPCEKDWCEIASLIAKSIPNAVVSHLGTAFGSRFYRYLAESKDSCAFIFKDNSESVQGVILGTMDHSMAYSIIKKNKFKLLLNANFRLLKWYVLKWILMNIMFRFFESNTFPSHSLKAELIAIAVSPEMRKKGVAPALIRQMENFFIKQNEVNAYYILTEKENAAANAFYQKIGAEHAMSFLSRGKIINYWIKNITG